MGGNVKLYSKSQLSGFHHIHVLWCDLLTYSLIQERNWETPGWPWVGHPSKATWDHSEPRTKKLIQPVTKASVLLMLENILYFQDQCRFSGRQREFCFLCQCYLFLPPCIQNCKCLKCSQKEYLYIYWFTWGV